MPVLGQVLFNKVEPSLRHQTVDALAGLNNPATQVLLEAALNDSDQYVRQQTEFCLNERDWGKVQNNAEPDTGPASQRTHG